MGTIKKYVGKDECFGKKKLYSKLFNLEIVYYRVLFCMLFFFKESLGSIYGIKHFLPPKPKYK